MIQARPPPMSSTVLEFATGRTLLHGAILRAAGVADVLRWRVEDPFGQRYEDEGILAEVDLVASDRFGALQMVRFMDGDTPVDIAASEAFRLTLDTAIVCKAFHRVGRTIMRIHKRWVFDDGGHLEEQAEPSDELELLQVAQRTLKSSLPAKTTTSEIATLWSRSCRLTPATE